AYGDCLLATCVYRDIHGSAFHFRWAHSTVAHNAVLIGGQGQMPRRFDSQGEIVDYEFSPAVDYLCGDALKAYGGQATLALRHVVYLRTKELTKDQQPQRSSELAQIPDVLIVLCDQVAAKEPMTFQFMLHALSPFKVDESSGQIVVERPRAGLVAQYVPASPLRFRQWDGYDPPPRERLPNQWHLEASTEVPQERVDMLTVLVPHRRGQAPAVKTRRVETKQLVGVEGTVGGVPFCVVFRTDRLGPPPEYQGSEVTKPFAVWWDNSRVK
ncbi:MAG: hypothetical protein NZ703_15295, partial [Gemmataceae bacterium]|nr:hypothetical protein [Gemmataceae bacterium]